MGLLLNLLKLVVSKLFKGYCKSTLVYPVDSVRYFFDRRLALIQATKLCSNLHYPQTCELKQTFSLLPVMDSIFFFPYLHCNINLKIFLRIVILNMRPVQLPYEKTLAGF